MYQGIIFGSVALLSVIILLSFWKVEERKFNIFIRTLTVVFCAIGFVRFFFSDSFIFAINGAWYEGVYYDKPDFWHAVLRWGYNTAYSVLPMAVFFKYPASVSPSQSSRSDRRAACPCCCPFWLLFLPDLSRPP